ncbi:organic solute transporter Ostalpha-domain-containing protein [Lactifluus volemus]|nr:organic solute transporter Ostalpha-domain-containing protein [Lactifluus volemus]
MSKNATCFAPEAPQKGPPLFQHGNVVFQAHDVGWIVSGIFTIIAIIASSWLINKHLQWYTNKLEQRYIIRLLLMVPIYASISLASYLFWDNATPLLLIRDAYEAILLTAFFYLLLTYLSPDPEVQKAIFRKRGLSREADAELRRRGLPPKKWVFPLCMVRWKPQDGLYFLQLMKWGVLQYCVVRPATTLVAVILNHIGLYCEQSWSPAWGHVYVRDGPFFRWQFYQSIIWQISSIISLSVTIAMYCLFQLYLCVAKELAPHRPVLKLFSVKSVVFLTFWQATFLSLLTMLQVVKDTPYMTAGEITIGWSAILETFEMSLFAFLHIKAFSYKPYVPTTPKATQTPRFRSFAHAMDFRETFREVRAGLVYMWCRMRGTETDSLARRVAVLDGAFDKSRARVWRERRRIVKGHDLEVNEVVEVEIDGERQWLGLGDDHGHGLSQSEVLDIQFEKVLERRGHRRSDPELGNVHPNFEQNYTHERSLWRSPYERVSQNNPDHQEPHALPSSSKSNSKRKSRRSRNAEQRVRAYDDQPPPSILRTYRDNRGATGSQVLLPDAQPTQENLVRADTVLCRLFSNPPLRSDGGKSSRSGRTSPTSHLSPSSQSHRTHLPLNSAPAALMQSVNAGRPVEVTEDVWGFHGEPAILFVPPQPMQQPQDEKYRTGDNFPPLPPPKAGHVSPSCESALHEEVPPAPVAAAVPVPTRNLVSDRERSPTPSRSEDQSRHNVPSFPELSAPPNPSPRSHRPARSRAYETILLREAIPSSPSLAPTRVEAARSTHAFTPNPLRQPRSKGARRTSAPVRSSLASRRSTPPSNYILSYLPDARSPPSSPRADQVLSRHQHS